MLGVLAVSLFLVSCLPPTGEASSLPVRPTESAVLKDDFFVLKMDDFKNEIVQYKGADRTTMTSPKIRFKLISSGETLESALTGGSATIRLSGKAYKIKLISPDRIDSPISIDYDGDGTLDLVHTKSSFHLKKLIDLNGVYYVQPVTCTEVKTLLEGESVPVESLGILNLNLIYVDAEKIRVSIDGASSGDIALGRGEYVGAPGASGAFVHNLGILYQAYAGGIHQATLCLR